MLLSSSADASRSTPLHDNRTPDARCSLLYGVLVAAAEKTPLQSFPAGEGEPCSTPSPQKTAYV